MSGIQKNIFSRKVYDGHTLKAEKKIAVSSNTKDIFQMKLKKVWPL